MDIKSRGAPLAASSVVRGQIGMPHICALRGGLAGTLQETVSGTLHMYIRQFMMLETQDTESKKDLYWDQLLIFPFLSEINFENVKFVDTL